MEATDLIKTLLEGFKAVAKTETIVGEGIKAGEFTILPVSKISLGIGAGAGTEQNRSRPLVEAEVQGEEGSVSNPSLFLL
jgi:uncharacterized spore protein YtfJ